MKNIKIIIECEMRERWASHFLGMLKTMQILGGMGSSRVVGLYADGDGDFNPKFIVNGKPIKEIETKEPVYDDSKRPKDVICDYFYDAG